MWFLEKVVRPILFVYFWPLVRLIQPFCKREMMRLTTWKKGWIAEHQPPIFSRIFDALLQEVWEGSDKSLSCEEFCSSLDNFDYDDYIERQDRAERDAMKELEPIYNRHVRRNFYWLYPLSWYCKACHWIASDWALLLYVMWPFWAGLIWVLTKVHITISWG